MTSTEIDSKLSKILTKLKTQIDGLHMIFETVRDIILELAKFLDDNKYCETSEICSHIKKLLADKIKETKITTRWIEECLPKEYKRKYDKSEFTSHSATKSFPASAGQYAVQEFRRGEPVHDLHADNLDDKHDSTYIEDITTENAELKEALLKKAFDNSLDHEYKFEVSKEKLVEIIDWLKNCKEKCFLIFNRGALVRIEMDSMMGDRENER